jgi:hypothetical protein
MQYSQPRTYSIRHMGPQEKYKMAGRVRDDGLPRKRFIRSNRNDAGPSERSYLRPSRRSGDIPL